MDELLVWLGRIVTLLPFVKQLWEATAAKDQKRQLEAQLALVRAMEDEQAREELGL